MTRSAQPGSLSRTCLWPERGAGPAARDGVLARCLLPWPRSAPGSCCILGSPCSRRRLGGEPLRAQHPPLFAAPPALPPTTEVGWTRFSTPASWKFLSGSLCVICLQSAHSQPFPEIPGPWGHPGVCIFLQNFLKLTSGTIQTRTRVPGAAQ